MPGPGDNTRNNTKTGSELTLGLSRFTAVAGVAAILSGCGSIWHPPGSGFANISNVGELGYDFERLVEKYDGRGQSIALDLVSRGGSCVKQELGRSAKISYQCVYFFCKGRTLQQISWQFAQTVTERPVNPDRPGLSYSFWDYSLTGAKGCDDRTSLMVKQQGFISAYGGRQLVSPRAAN